MIDRRIDGTRDAPCGLMNRAPAILLTSFVVGLAACASEPETSPAAGDDVLTVDASDETKKELGVVEWQVTTDDAAGSIHAVGVDGSGATRAEVAITAEKSGEQRATLTYEVTAPETFTLRYDLDSAGEAQKPVESAASPAVRAVLVRLGADLDGAPATRPQELTTSTLAPRDEGSSGQLVKPGQEVRKRSGTCLIDSDGKACMGKLLTTAGALVGFGVCLVATPASFGLTAACGVAAGVTAVGSMLDMKESGCKPRSCSEKK
jgi:hypothetical protein